MLSEDNVSKLVRNGLYWHEPDKRYRPSMFWDDMYHCFNWTFQVLYRETNRKWYMIDTYFKDKYIELADENFDEFEFLFDFNEVDPHSGRNIYDYDRSDWWHVAVDSGGMYCGGKYFIRKGAVKNKEKVLERMRNEISSIERDLEYRKKIYDEVANNEQVPRYV